MTESAPAVPRPSATIVIVRDSDAGPEVLLVKRRAGDAFGNAYTFPGGVIDPDESDARPVCAGLSEQEANSILGVDHGLDYYTAVIRELFEVDRCELAWSDFLRSEGFCMAVDALHYFAWWITPVNSPKRWTTRFFAAELPPGQDAKHDGKELTDSRWLTPTAALELRLAGEIKLPQPTRRNLGLMKDFETADDLLGWASARHLENITSICPVQVFVEGVELYPIPGDEHYPESA